MNFGKDVMKYIITHYTSGISSRDAAKELHMEHSFFCRSFKKTFGCCFTDYILAYRLEKAKVLLRSSELSVTEIAFKIGFNDCSYFLRKGSEARLFAIERKKDKAPQPNKKATHEGWLRNM